MISLTSIPENELCSQETVGSVPLALLPEFFQSAFLSFVEIHFSLLRFTFWLPGLRFMRIFVARDAQSPCASLRTRLQ